MLKNYLKIAWKVLLRRKFFTFISLFGISFTLMILLVVTSMIDHIFGAKAPLTNENRILNIFEIKSITNEPGNTYSSQNALSYNFLKDYVKTLKIPEKVSIYSNLHSVNAFINKQKLVLDQRCTDEVYWEIANYTFLEGSGFKALDLERANMVAVINETTKKEYFGVLPALGKEIHVDGKTYKVCGVVKDAPITTLQTYGDIWIPLTTSPGKLKSWNQYHGSCNALILAKNKKDLPLIKIEVSEMMKYVNTLPKKEHETHYVFAVTFAEHFSKNLFRSNVEKGETEFGKLILTVSLIALLFMFIPSINLININISRIMERTSEIGARRAFGATKNKLVVQFLIENIFLTFIGCLIGFVFAFITLELINHSKLIAFANFSINMNVFFYGLLLTLVFGILSGVYPAFKMSRLQPVEALKGGAL